MHTYVIALDQGTTSSRAVLFDENAHIVAMKSYEFEQLYPQPGWVEHDPTAILNTQIDALREVVRISGVPLEKALRRLALPISAKRRSSGIERQDGLCITQSFGNAAEQHRL